MAKGKKVEAFTLETALIPDEEKPFKIPDNWIWVRLGCLGYTNIGLTYKPADTTNDGIIVLRSSNIQDGRMDYEDIVMVDMDVPESKMCKKGDILICARNGSKSLVGKTAIIDRDGMSYGAFMAIFRSEYNPLIYYFLNSHYFRNLIDSDVNTTTINQVTQALIKNLAFPLPPLAEQQRIVGQIENLFSKLDEAKEKAQEAINSYDNRRTMIVHNAFEGMYSKHWRKENGCNIDEWENLTLDDVADYKKGPFGSSITKAMFVPKGENTYKVYEQGNAIRKTLGYGSYYITEEKYKELKGFAIEAGDIIISCAGTIGEVYKLPDNCEAGVINQALMRVRIYPNIDEKFFTYYFGEVLKGDVNEQANGTAIKNIPPFKIMKAMTIKLPSLEEQKYIVNLLDGLLEKEEAVKNTAEQAIEQIKLMKKSILAKAFRGELGTNNPEEESSFELLRQIIES